MAPPYYPKVEVGGHHYYPAPYSLEPLPLVFRRGLAVLGALALLSVGATLTLILFIGWRLVFWRLHYRTFLGHNQYVILVLNLLLADFQQSVAFLFSLHWIRKDGILAPTAPCFAQGWLIHSGDVGSGCFVLAIAVHTFLTAVRGVRIRNHTFVGIVVCIWVFTYLVTAIGVGLHRNKYFVRAGAWCWVSEAYEDDRLALHYIWVFVVQFGTVLLYIATFCMLRRKTSQLFSGHRTSHLPNIATVRAVNRITKIMMLYPCVYVVLTLPLSAGRMWSMAHHSKPYSNSYAILAGALLTSCGWVDTLLYTLTRRQLLKDTMPQGSSSTRSDYSREAGGRSIAYTRTVTVDTGTMDALNLTAAPKHSRQVHLDCEDMHRGGIGRASSISESIDCIPGCQQSYGYTTTKVSAGRLNSQADSDQDKQASL